jgi:hypothetical protein
MSSHSEVDAAINKFVTLILKWFNTHFISFYLFNSASTDPAINPNAPTFFDKIISNEVKANRIYEDDLWWEVIDTHNYVCDFGFHHKLDALLLKWFSIAFRDINPQGPVHFLVIPKGKQQ